MIDFGDRKFWAGLAFVFVFLLAAYIAFHQGFLFWFDECAAIENPELREECYTGKAVDNADPTVCDNIEDKEGCDLCKGQVEDAVSSGGGGGSSSSDGGGGGTDYEVSEEGCSALTGNVRDWCYRELAIQEMDPSICLMISDEYYRDSCFKYIAEATGDPSYCEYMQDAERRKWCHEVLG